MEDWYYSGFDFVLDFATGFYVDAEMDDGVHGPPDDVIKDELGEVGGSLGGVMDEVYIHLCFYWVILK